MKKLKLMVVGAHPDDCDLSAGGTALKFITAGHEVMFLSVSNGDKGHQEMSCLNLAKRRYEETQAVALKFGITYKVLDIPDCNVEANLENREKITAVIREFSPDVLITHRPYDYHVDHRNTSLLVQDASFLLTVPHFCPGTPAMRRIPVILYMCDNFKKPLPFKADLIVDISDKINEKMQMLDFQVSQFYEWLPWLDGYIDQIPSDKQARFEWLRNSSWKNNDRKISQRFRALLIEKLGQQKGEKVEYAEAFEFCEYGKTPSEEIYEMFI